MAVRDYLRRGLQPVGVSMSACKADGGGGYRRQGIERPDGRTISVTRGKFTSGVYTTVWFSPDRIDDMTAALVSASKPADLSPSPGPTEEGPPPVNRAMAGEATKPIAGVDQTNAGYDAPEVV